MADWKTLLATPSPEAWTALRERVRPNAKGLPPPELETVLAALEHWPDSLRVVRREDLAGIPDEPDFGLHDWLMLCREGPALDRDALVGLSIGLGLVELPNLRARIDHLHLIDHDGEGLAERIERSFLGSVRSLSASQNFNGDAFGGTLNRFGASVRRVEVSINGYEPYAQSHGLDADKPVRAPFLRHAEVDAYPLSPAAVPALADGELPSLRTLRLPLVAGGGLAALMAAAWFPTLQSLAVELMEHPDRSDERYLRWLESNLEGYDAASDRMRDGVTRTDHDVRALAQHPATAGLRSLTIRGALGPAALASLAESRSLAQLELLWIPAATVEARARIAEALPNTELRVGGPAPWCGERTTATDPAVPPIRDGLRLQSTTWRAMLEEEEADYAALRSSST